LESATINTTTVAVKLYFVEPFLAFGDSLDGEKHTIGSMNRSSRGARTLLESVIFPDAFT